MSWIITVQMWAIFTIWIIYLLLPSRNGQISCGRLHPLQLANKPQITENVAFVPSRDRRQTEVSEMEECVSTLPNMTETSGMSAMFFLPLTPSLLHLHSLLLSPTSSPSSSHPRLQLPVSYFPRMINAPETDKSAQSRKRILTVSEEIYLYFSDTWLKNFKVGRSSGSHKQITPLEVQNGKLWYMMNTRETV